MKSNANKGKSVWAGIFALGMTAGCATSEAFRPAERATARSPQGYAAADYDLDRPEGEIGDVKVWSKGTSRVRREGEKEKLTTIHVGFAVENRSDEPLAFDTRDLYVDVATEKEGMVENLRPARIEGSPDVAPGGDRLINAYFVLPDGIGPTDVDAFRVRWQLADGEESYKQRTPFLEVPPAAPYPYGFYYSPFYDPFLFAPYGYPGPFALPPYPYYYGY